MSSPSDRVADAAIAVIARHGLDALSVRSVARAAKLTGGAVQHHFPTRNDLVVAALDRTVRRQSARAVAVAIPDSVLDRLVGELCAILPSDPRGREEAIVWIAMSAAASGSELVAERHGDAVEQTRRWLVATLRRAVSAGELDRTIDPALLAPVIEAGLDGILLQAIASDDSHAVLCGRMVILLRALLGCNCARGVEQM